MADDKKNIPDTGKVDEPPKPGKVEPVKADPPVQDQPASAKAEAPVTEDASKVVTPPTMEKPVEGKTVPHPAAEQPAPAGKEAPKDKDAPAPSMEGTPQPGKDEKQTTIPGMGDPAPAGKVVDFTAARDGVTNETPFVVEWFVKNGIEVWSTQEGEQRFDSHTDKLTNYIRFWQADGESEKTSIRTKTALGQLVEGGGFKGGLAPYGYDLVKSGRFNKRKHELYDLVVNETEAAVVRIIFDKYVHEGFGAQRIATYLNKQGYRARTGKMWHHASIRGIVCNLTYTGVLRCGESRSQELPHLQIISPELFEAAQHIRTSRANSAEQERHIPLNTRGNSLLAGNVYCGHCGSRLSLTTNGKAYPCKEDPNRVVKRVRYVCYGKTRKQTDCDGQTGYTAHILDGIIDKLVRQIFERMKAIPKSDIVNIRYREKMEERKSLLHSVRAEYAKAVADLETLKGEVIKTIRGESTFSKELLSSLIAEAEAKCRELQESMKTAQAAYDEGKTVLASLNAQYDDIISWAEMYDTASVEAKKMIVSCLIKRVEVYRDYKLHIDFNIDFEQFTGGLDIVAIAA